MRKIFIGFALVGLLFSASAVLADRVKGPDNIPHLSVFVLGSTRQDTCGLIRFYQRVDFNKKKGWIKYFVDGTSHPVITQEFDVVVGQGIESFHNDKFWLDSNSSGHFTEYIAGREEMSKKYPTPCDAVKK